MILNTINGILQKQKRSEYKVKDESDTTTTNTSEEITCYIEKVFVAIQTFFEPNVQTILLTEFGLEIYE